MQNPHTLRPRKYFIRIVEGNEIIASVALCDTPSRETEMAVLTAERAKTLQLLSELVGELKAQLAVHGNVELVAFSRN
jgi:hypothetical protein